MSMFAATAPAIAPIAALAIGLAAGAVIGLVHFGALGGIVRSILIGAPVRTAALQAARFVFVGLAFFALAKLGAGPLAAGLGGLLLARQVLLRRFGRVP